MTEDDWTPICGRVCPCPVDPAVKARTGWTYAGECTKDAGHVEAGDRKHATGSCEWTEPEPEPKPLTRNALFEANDGRFKS